MIPTPHLLIFGATGAIGESIAVAAVTRGWRVTGISRSLAATPTPGVNHLSLDPLTPDFTPELLRTEVPYTAICWAQGTNLNDSIYEFDPTASEALYRANVLYILVTLNALLTAQLLAPATRMVVISSIWQNIARQNKLSYCISKSALQGLVLSLAADLGRDQHLINAVLPGALDTPMTRQNLGPAQIDKLAAATLHNRLPALQDVASLACYLLSPENSGITGQFIAADLGFSNVRIL